MTNDRGDYLTPKRRAEIIQTLYDLGMVGHNFRPDEELEYMLEVLSEEAPIIVSNPN